MSKSKILSSLGIVFLGIIILGILGRLGHLLVGFVMLVLSLIGAVVVFQKLTGIEGEVHLYAKHTGSAQQKTESKRVEQRHAMPGQIVCSHCGTLNPMANEICVTCGWPLPAKIQKAGAGV
ncbi:MAG: zinc ribbon domain-containing protein [Clostridia bacterium]|nr:zinc ribbon domain-containing protein [Clostridia bacterium]